MGSKKCARKEMYEWVWSKLPDDLMIELWHRLPKDALLEFRCVSKACNFMISKLFLPKLAASAPVTGFVFQWVRSYDPNFTDRRINKLRLPPFPYRQYCYGYVTETGGSLDPTGGELVSSYLSLLPFKPLPNDFLGIFNGFFLVRNTSSLPIQYYVCNPATKQFVPIPINPTHLQQDSFAGLAFDPLVPHDYHNFKIVRFDCCKPWELDIFSSAMGKWVHHTVPLEPEILEFRWITRSIYVNGVFYMLSMLSHYLVCFDLLDSSSDNNNNTPKARAVKLPPRSWDCKRALFEASSGYLYLACKVDNDLLVWTYHNEEEDFPWTFKYNITISALGSLRFRHLLPRQLDIFAVDLSAQIIYIGSEYTVFTYDIKNNHIINYEYRDYGYLMYSGSLVFYPYSCSLVRLSDQFSLE